MGVLSNKISKANALGIKNLADKGVLVSGNATTHQIMQRIADILLGDIYIGGTPYTNVKYNSDHSITLTDADGEIHTIKYTSLNGLYKTISYDGINIPLKFVGNDIDKIGDTSVIFNSLPSMAGNTVEFYSDYELYEIVTLGENNSTDAPVVEPKKDDFVFSGWMTEDGYIVEFPFTPSNPLTRLHANFPLAETILYDYFGVSKAEYPYACINFYNSSSYNYQLVVLFAKSVELSATYKSTTMIDVKKALMSQTRGIEHNGSAQYMVDWITDNFTDNTLETIDSTSFGSGMFSLDTFANFECKSSGDIYRFNGEENPI